MGEASLVVVCGPPGVGKSTVAEAVADRRDGTHLRTDVVRRDVVDDPEYTERERRRVYDELFDRARAALAAGECVVLDGTFQFRETRDRAAAIAEEAGAAFDVVRVTCDEPVVRERIAARSDDPSDAVFENYLTIRESFDPVERPHLTVDNSGPLDETLDQVDDWA